MPDLTNHQLLEAMRGEFATKDNLKNELQSLKNEIVTHTNELIQPLIDGQDRMQATLDGVVKVASLGQLAEATTKDHELRITRLELQANQ